MNKFRDRNDETVWIGTLLVCLHGKNAVGPQQLAEAAKAADTTVQMYRERIPTDEEMQLMRAEERKRQGIT